MTFKYEFQTTVLFLMSKKLGIWHYYFLIMPVRFGKRRHGFHSLGIVGKNISLSQS